ASVIFFFSSRRRHTRFSRDWSSDVCSSDLDVSGLDQLEPGHASTSTLGAGSDADNLVALVIVGGQGSHNSRVGTRGSSRGRVNSLADSQRAIHLRVGDTLKRDRGVANTVATHLRVDLRPTDKVADTDDIAALDTRSNGDGLCIATRANVESHYLVILSQRAERFGKREARSLG